MSVLIWTIAPTLGPKALLVFSPGHGRHPTRILVGRMLRRRPRLSRFGGPCAAHAYSVGGAIWLWVYAAQGQLLGFGGEWALLTAAHFHAAGVGVTAFTALVHRATGQGGRLLILHPIIYACVAIGLFGFPLFERIGAIGYIALFAIQAFIVIRNALPALVIIAALVPLGTLTLAIYWAFGGRVIPFDTMIYVHGAANAVGHIALGLLAFAWMDLPAREARITAPFSRLRACAPACA